MNVKPTRGARIAFLIGVVLIMFFVLFPYFWLVCSSFKTSNEIFAVVPTLFPKAPTLEGYKYALSIGSRGPKLVPTLKNSLTIASITAVCTIFFAATGGYAIGRQNFPGKKYLVVFILLAQMFQGPVIMIPWYRMAAAMGIINTKTALVLIYLTATIPICVWLMSGFAKTLPYELEEAAAIDGCNPFRTFLSIIMPLLKGGLVSILIYAFIIAWNDYQYALILTTSAKAKTVQLTIGELMGSMGIINWGGITACGVIVTIPAIILFSCIQRYLIEGLTAGAVKG